MGYLSREDRLARRMDPGLVLEGGRSIIVSSLFYWPGQSAFPSLAPSVTQASQLRQRVRRFYSLAIFPCPPLSLSVNDVRKPGRTQ